MRVVTIKRGIALSGAFKPVSIYIEDAERGTVEINGVLCRRVATVKCGKARLFDAGVEAVRIFASLGDTVSPGSVTEYLIEAGTEPVYIEGKCVRLEGTVQFCFGFSMEKQYYAKASISKKHLYAIIITVSVLILTVGVIIPLGVRLLDYYGAKNLRPTDFTVGEMTITLTNAFEEVEPPYGIDKHYVSPFCGVLFLCESYADVPAFVDISPEDYCDVIKIDSGNATPETETRGDLVWFEYDYYEEELHASYTYYLFAYKSDDAMWLVQFYVLTDGKENVEGLIFDMADSVRFD